MKKFAGNDILNCKEFLIGRLEIIQKLEGASAEKTEDEANPNTGASVSALAAMAVISTAAVVLGKRK